MDPKAEKLELYKVMVESISLNEQKRQKGNALYITLTVGIITVYPAISMPPSYLATMIAAISFVWWRTIEYHRHLAAAKFDVLLPLEEELSVQLFANEWSIFKKKKARMELTQIERLLPFFLLSVSISYLVFSAII